jgi:LysM repeat protein
MSSYTPERARRLDIFKLIVLLILLALLLWLFCRQTPGATPPSTSTAVVAVITAAPPTTAPNTATAVSPTEAPVAPALTSPKGGEAVKSGGDITLSGTGVPGSQVQIVVDGKPVGTVTVGPDGAWSFPIKLDPGEHSIVVQALDAGGKVVAESEAVKVTAEAAAVAPPILVSPKPGDKVASGDVALSGAGAPGSKVQIVVDGEVVGVADVGADGTWSFPVTLEAGEHTIIVQALGADGKAVAESEPVKVTAEGQAVKPALTSPKPGDKLNSGDATLNGTGAPGSKVQIVVDGEVVGTAEVGADGTWSFPVKLDPGDHQIAVQSLDASGNVVSESDAVSVSVAAPAPTPTPTPRPQPSGGVCVGPRGRAEGEVWIVGGCDTMTYISKQTGIPLGALIAANPQVKNPDLIYPDQRINLPR